MDEFTSEYFDNASKEWMKNKRKLKNGIYVYICAFVDKNGTKCTNDVRFRSNQSCEDHYFKLMDKINYELNKIEG